MSNVRCKLVEPESGSLQIRRTRILVLGVEYSICRSLIQGTFGGTPGNFELVVSQPIDISTYKLVHYYRDNSTGTPTYQWYGPTAVISTQASGATGVAASLIQSNYNSETGPGNLEVVVIDIVGGSTNLVHYYRNGTGPNWIKAETLSTLAIF